MIYKSVRVLVEGYLRKLHQEITILRPLTDFVPKLYQSQKIYDFRDITHYSPMKTNRCFGLICRLYLGVEELAKQETNMKPAASIENYMRQGQARRKRADE
jgi:hypothetical protein